MGDLVFGHELQVGLGAPLRCGASGGVEFERAEPVWDGAEGWMRVWCEFTGIHFSSFFLSFFLSFWTGLETVGNTWIHVGDIRE